MAKKFSKVAKADKRWSVIGNHFMWVCSLSCGHTQEAYPVKKGRCDWKPAPTKLACRQCEKPEARDE